MDLLPKQYTTLKLLSGALDADREFISRAILELDVLELSMRRKSGFIIYIKRKESV
jgi:hypothetical protein